MVMPDGLAGIWWLCLAAWGGALVLTGVMRRYALAKQVMDVPNDRSSHQVPTPRGGGVAIVAAFLVAVLAAWFGGRIGGNLATAMLGSGLLVAGVGFVDDHRHIAARWRLLTHFAAAFWALYWLGGPPPFPMPGGYIDLGWLGWILGALYLVWMLNLYNFMDGIDGIAGAEAIAVGLGGAACHVAAGGAEAGYWLPLLLAAAAGGFLVWNWPPARIFMGDAGSGFLGLVLAVLSLLAAHDAPLLLWSWLILLGAFVVDATLTLMRRMLRGQKVYQAHRSHAYQHAAREYGAHRPVTLAVAALTFCWLLPWALGVATGSVDGMLALAAAYAPLVVVALRFRAGVAD